MATGQMVLLFTYRYYRLDVEEWDDVETAVSVANSYEEAGSAAPDRIEVIEAGGTVSRVIPNDEIRSMASAYVPTPIPTRPESGWWEVRILQPSSGEWADAMGAHCDEAQARKVCERLRPFLGDRVECRRDPRDLREFG